MKLRYDALLYVVLKSPYGSVPKDRRASEAVIRLRADPKDKRTVNASLGS